MTQPTPDPTQRFSDRVENYIRYRPNYPTAVLNILHQATNLTPTSTIADIGSGTGISTQLFLNNGNPVFGVEPNPHMRQAAETILKQYPNFHSINGTAEATTLGDRSVDYVIAAQAFHWFNRPAAQQEFARILRPNGWIVLMWNSRRTDTTPFLRAYESLLQQFGTDYNQVQHKTIERDELRSFFADGTFQQHTLYNEQRLDYDGIKGRLLSTSYTPNETHPDRQPMLQELDRIFQQHSESGSVCLEYDTQLYIGQL
ncbi:MAG: methyltransferase domain-containing protein [Cyanobacteria bacterium J06597_1]